MTDPITLDAVQELLAGNLARSQKPRRSGRTYLLSGLVKCGLCHGAMVGYSRTKDGKRYSYYRCYRREDQGRVACQGLRVRAEKLESFVIQELLNLATDEAFLADTQKHIDEIQSLMKTTNITQDVEQIDRSIRQNQRKIDRILDAYEDGLINKTDFKTRYQHLQERLTALESSRERLVDQASREHVSFENMQASFDDMLKFGYNWEHLSEEGKQKRLQAVLKEVRVTKELVDIDLIVEGWELSHLDYRRPGWT